MWTMPDSHHLPWSNSPSAQRYMYITEKSWVAGTLIGSMLYGMLIVLFFKCMTALLNPVHRGGEGIRWGLVSYTAVMFSLATVNIAMNFHIQSISYIDDRDFPGVEGELPPGPYGYSESIYLDAVNIVPNAAFSLNNWLADGFLLYRCYVVYSMNLGVIVFPCLMYLASMAMGVLTIYPIGERKADIDFSLPYFSISVSLNILLTLMIVVRLILHGRRFPVATESTAGIGGLYKAIAAMLIESSALFAVTSLLVIGPMGAGSAVTSMFFPVLAETQVIAQLLIIQRVASKRALTSNTTVSGSVSPFKARSRGELRGGDRYSVMSLGELEAGLRL